MRLWDKLALVALVVFAIFTIAIQFFGYELTSADIPGSLIAIPILAYLLHLFAGKED